MSAATAVPARTVTVLICALGGEGGGVLTQWLVEAAKQAGYPAQATSIPGVAQRTGATTYYFEALTQPLAELGGRVPVFSLYPVPGELDVLVSSELLETARQVGLGLTSRTRTQIISSSARTLTTNERMQLADGRLEQPALISVVEQFSRERHVIDMAAIAQQTGTVVSAVMFGALAAGGALPFSRAVCEAVIGASGIGAAASLRGFASAFEMVAASRRRISLVDKVMAGKAAAPSEAQIATDPARTLPGNVADRFPLPVHAMLALGYWRLVDYQDEAYARDYVKRMETILAAERAGDAGTTVYPITKETARYLALWMAFDDIVRVAALKARRARHARVGGEVKIASGDLLRVYDYFKPGVAEFAALLPAQLAQALIRADRRRVARGHDAFALPLKIATHGVVGIVALRMLASLRWLRRRGSRFAMEQALIVRWLGAIEQGTRESSELGLEIAACGRLIKGYGSTNERGRDNLLHIVENLAPVARGSDARAQARVVHAACVAALQDDAGGALDALLDAQGARKRPVKESPIRVIRRTRRAGVDPVSS